MIGLYILTGILVALAVGLYLCLRVIGKMVDAMLEYAKSLVDEE